MPIFVTNNSFLPAPAKRVRRAGEGSSGETSRLPLLLSGGTGISNQPWARQGARSVRVSRWRGPCKCEFMVVGLARCIWLAPISRSMRPLFPSAFREIKALRPRRLYVSRVLPSLAAAARLSPDSLRPLRGRCRRASSAPSRPCAISPPPTTRAPDRHASPAGPGPRRGAQLPSASLPAGHPPGPHRAGRTTDWPAGPNAPGRRHRYPLRLPRQPEPVAAGVPGPGLSLRGCKSPDPWFH